MSVVVRGFRRRGELARSGPVQCGTGYDAARQRSARLAGGGCVLPERAGPQHTRRAAGQNQAPGLSGTDQTHGAGVGALDQGVGQDARGLSVHPFQDGTRCQADLPHPAQPFGQNVGGLVGTTPRAVCVPQFAADQGAPALPRGRQGRRYLPNVRAFLRSLHHGVSGHRSGTRDGDQPVLCADRAVQTARAECQGEDQAQATTASFGGAVRPQAALSKRCRAAAKIMVIFGALWVGCLTPASAQSLSDLWQPQDCRAVAIAERERLEAAGQTVERSHLMQIYGDCSAANSEAELAGLEKRVEAFSSELTTINMRIDNLGRIIDENNEQIARLRREEGQLQLDISASQARQEAMLRQAEQILQGLAQQ